MNYATIGRINDKLDLIDKLKKDKDIKCFVFSGYPEIIYRTLTKTEIKGLTLRITRTDVTIMLGSYMVFPMINGLQFQNGVEKQVEKHFRMAMEDKFNRYSCTPRDGDKNICYPKAKFYYSNLMDADKEFNFSSEFVNECRQEYEKYLNWVIKRKTETLDRIVKNGEIKYFGDDD